MKKPIGIFFILILQLFCGQNTTKFSNKADFGKMDLRQHSFEKIPFVSLEGSWGFFWNRSPAGLEDESPIYFLSLPSHWNGYEMPYGKLPGMGHAVFRLQVLLPKENTSFALLIREQDTSFALYANGNLLGGSGVPNSNSVSYKPQTRSSLIVLPKEQSLNLNLYVANFAHRKGGPWNEILLAPYEAAESLLARNKMDETLLASVLGFVSIFFLFLYSYDKDSKHTLSIFFFSFVICLRTISTGERILLDYVDFPYAAILRLEYLSWFWAAPSLYRYFAAIYPEDFSKKVGSIFYTISFLLSLGLFLPSSIFTESASIYPFIFVSNGIFLFYYLIQSYLNKRSDSKLLLLGVLLLLFASLNDTLHAQALIHSIYVGPTSVVFLVFLQVFSFGKLVRERLKISIQTTEELKAINASYSRFVPKEFLFHLGKRDILEVDLGDQVQKRMTVLFADIRSFTEFSETLSPKENFDFLNSYLQRVGPIIRHNQGFIDKFIGDAVMALFPYDPNDAIKAAVMMQETIQIYNGHRANCGYAPIEVGIGIHTGNLTLGILGEHKRMEGTVISDAVNLASRIEGITKLFSARILISGETFIAANDTLGYEYRLLDRVPVKGKSESVYVVEVLDGYEAEKRDRLKNSKLEYTLALEAYQRKEFAEAELMFRELLDLNPDDSITRVFWEKSKESLILSKLQEKNQD